jgi:flagellar biosynthesis regulator FlbT
MVVVEATRLEAIDNIDKYQKETKAWRDIQVVRKEIQSEDLILRKKPNIETSTKLESK